jgi:uncharacterized protein
MTATDDIPDPVIDQDSKAYWDGCSNKKLLYGHCRECQKGFFYPRPFCPICFSADVELLESSGRGTIYSCSVFRRIERPYGLAYVTLEEGPTMMTNIVECNFDNIKIGDPVEVVFVPAQKGTLVPMFRPATAP